MLTTALALVVLGPKKAVSPGDMLRGVLSNYGSVQRAVIEIDRGFEGGSYPGSYTQQLTWDRSRGYDLTVTGSDTSIPRAQRAPNYYGRGDSAWAEYPDGRRTSRPRRGTTGAGAGANAGWDAAGDPVFNSMEGGTLPGFPINPLNDSGATYSYGKKKSWKGEPVQEIQMKTGADGNETSASFFVSPNGQRLVGVQYRQGNNIGWVHYRNQSLTFRQSATMGVDPE